MMGAGTFYYVGYVNWIYAYPPVDSSFMLIPLGGHPIVPGAQLWQTACIEEPFPYEVATAPDSAMLKDASPNPFNPATVLGYELRVPSLASLKVYDTAGRLVTTLVDGWREAGTHEVTFDGSKLASGMYLYILQSNGQTATGKMMLLK
jgi:hypothetical protein